MSATKAKPSVLPIGELAYRAYSSASDPARMPHWSELLGPTKRIWAETETAIANNTIAMMAAVLEKLGTPMAVAVPGEGATKRKAGKR